ncbi:15523_t:CDS:2 [Acaulospora morrowiae]|uniref:15523_t:CDS:1 n=1 Tax=Acaulospora morrowiae TaxID=94023 RepID=A0A9N8V5U1_9GLOM|nr:15523_t:CDS:2 [Acaulospora morrowiae]
MRLSYSLRTSFVFRQIQINDIKARYKQTFTNTTQFSDSKSSCSTPKVTFDEDQDSGEVIETSYEPSPASINTITKSSFVRETDVPWNGEEEIETTVLRMIVDKYPPLKVRRGSVKEYIDAHGRGPVIYNSSFNGPNSSSSNFHSPHESLFESGNPTLSPENLNRSNKNVSPSTRSSRKHPEMGPAKKTKDVDEHRSKHQNEALPRSIAAWNSIVERRIQDAISAGEFKNLPYRGKPLPPDPNENNPYLDRTELLMNRLVQRQGAAPAWIEYQKEVDKEITAFRNRILESWSRYSSLNNLSPQKPNRKWEEKQVSYCEKIIIKLNSRLRSYNTVAPYAARRCYLSLEDEFRRMYQNVRDEGRGTMVDRTKNDGNDEVKKNDEVKDGDNIWMGLAKGFKWLIGH